MASSFPGHHRASFGVEDVSELRAYLWRRCVVLERQCQDRGGHGAWDSWKLRGEGFPVEKREVKGHRNGCSFFGHSESRSICSFTTY